MGNRPVPRIGAAWIAYVAAFFVLHRTGINDMAAAFALVPAFYTIWVFGLRASYVIAALMVPFHAVLFAIDGHRPGWDLVAGVEGFFGLTTLTMASLAFGFTVDRLRRSESHMEIQDRHMAVVAHELRNPLTAVIGLAQTLVEMWDDLDTEEARSIAEMIAGESKTLNAIIADLLDAGRVKRESLQVGVDTFDLVEVVGEIHRGVLAEAPVHAWADAARTGQIVRNLIKNAEAHGAHPVEVSVWEADGLANVEVRDRGNGVPEEILGRLFSPFVSHGGPASTGLGLWLSRALAEAMGGELIHLRSDGWTRFRLGLPVAPRTTPHVMATERVVWAE